MDQNRLTQILQAGRFEWRRHALQRLLERGISRIAVIDVLMLGEEIEDYPADKPYPSALFLGWIEDRPLHVVVALDEKTQWAYIITAYEPSLEYFEADFKTRRKV